MTSVWPQQNDYFVAKVDNTEDVEAADVNALQASIEAMQNNIGNNVQNSTVIGPFPTLADRVAALEQLVASGVSINTDPGGIAAETFGAVGTPGTGPTAAAANHVHPLSALTGTGSASTAPHADHTHPGTYLPIAGGSLTGGVTFSGGAQLGANQSLSGAAFSSILQNLTQNNITQLGYNYGTVTSSLTVGLGYMWGLIKVGASNITITLEGPSSSAITLGTNQIVGYQFTALVQQDGTGGRTFSFASSNGGQVIYPQGGYYYYGNYYYGHGYWPYSSNPNAVDVVQFFTPDMSNWYALNLGLGFLGD